ncbi:MAG: ATP synthase subunit I [Opitutaceae bacterium]
MNETLILVLAGAAGVGFGAVFFGGLWWTVRRGVASPRPALWFLGSALLRTFVALAGFYFVSGGQWQRLTACLVGFIAARLVVMWLTGHQPKQSPPPRRKPDPSPLSSRHPNHQKIT